MSRKVQAKVYDRMTALEQPLIQPPTAKPSLIQPRKEFRAMYGIARLIGCDKNLAAFSGNQAKIRAPAPKGMQLAEQHLFNVAT